MEHDGYDENQCRRSTFGWSIGWSSRSVADLSATSRRFRCDGDHRGRRIVQLDIEQRRFAPLTVIPSHASLRLEES
jgi:hypothetical protein